MHTHNYTWSDWLSALAIHHAPPQASDDSTTIHVWFYDNVEVHTSSMWREDVPYTILPTYSQETNDADVAAFDAMFATGIFNKAIEPRSHDGYLMTQPVTLTSGQWHYWHSEGDDLIAKTVRGGQAFEVSLAKEGDSRVTWAYRDPVWIAGGWFKYTGALLGDQVSFTIFAPATEVTPNNENTGNCNVFSGVIVPSSGGNSGAFDVDLSLANPIPTSDGPPYAGYWDYAMPANMRGRGVLSAGTPGQAKYVLINSRVDLDCFVGKGRLLGDGKNDYNPNNIQVSLCLPEWQFECTVHNKNGTNTLQGVWELLVGRYWTT